MEAIFGGLAPGLFALAVLVTALAGLVKGAVGFAMPMIMISGFATFLPPDLALAGLILPTLASNLTQALGDGWPVFLATVRQYWRFLLGTLVFIPISAPLVGLIPAGPFLLILGVPITVFAGLQLAGVPLRLHLRHAARTELALGVVGGLYGGVSGVWGPPLLVYLLSTDTPRDRMVRAQGVVFLLGAVMLTGSHLVSGVLNAASVPFSAALVIPALAGQGLGAMIRARIDQARFRRWTQGLLALTGLNLIRAGIDRL